MLNKCIVKDCDRIDIVGRGMCQLHYYRWKRNGDPEYVNPSYITRARCSQPSLRQTHPREYNSWTSMKTRCYNKKYPQYKDYGGRGIKVCDRWLGTNGFKNFFSDMGERPLKCSLDRINNELGYSKNNCRWATRKMQSNNTRKTCWLEYNGEKMSLSDWAQKKGFPPELIYNRIMNYKWSTKKALETPWVKKERNKK